MRSQGIKIDLMGNITSGFKRKPAVAAAANPPAKADGAKAAEADDEPTGSAPTEAGPTGKPRPIAKPGGRTRRKSRGKSRRKRSGGSG